MVMVRVLLIMLSSFWLGYVSWSGRRKGGERSRGLEGVSTEEGT